MTIEEAIKANAINSPSKTALIVGENRISYGQMWNYISEAAGKFRELDLAIGDRVLLSASKSEDFVFAYFGAHLARLICVPVDSETNPTRLQRIMECAKPKVLMGELRHAEGLKVIPFFELSGNDDKGNAKLPTEDDIADIMFTTGTTGLPKGVALSYRNEEAAAAGINEFIGNTKDDIEILALPISHSFGLGRLRCVLSKGGTLVLLGSFASMKKFFKALEDNKATGFGMVPSSWAYIRKMSGDKLGKFSDQLKYIEIGSAFMPVSEKKRLIDLLPKTRICMHYGLTEASRSTFQCFCNDEERLATIGKATPGAEIAVFDEKGNRLDIGQDGEICVKGEHVCSGYWGQNKEEFRKDFYGNYFRTGDYGHQNSNGEFSLVSRLKEIINVGGKKVSPLEVEEAINNIPGVLESACIGVPDPVLGEVVKAYVVSDIELDAKTLQSQLTNSLENYKVPAIVERISQLPKTASGKIQRVLLKQNSK